MNEEEFIKEQNTDFMIKIDRGGIIPPSHPNYHSNRVIIKIFNKKLEELDNYKIQIEGKEYIIKSQNILNRIIELITNDLETLINWSLNQNNDNLERNALEGGMGRFIRIKYGNLIINVNGQVMDIGDLCDEFINKIVTLIINEGDKTDEDYIKEVILNSTNSFESKDKENSSEDYEFESYCKLYEEKFGRHAYIAEPSGKKEQTINAIKICLERNEDILDQLLYPNNDSDYMY